MLLMGWTDSLGKLPPSIWQLLQVWLGAAVRGGCWLLLSGEGS